MIITNKVNNSLVHCFRVNVFLNTDYVWVIEKSESTQTTVLFLLLCNYKRKFVIIS